MRCADIFFPGDPRISEIEYRSGTSIVIRDSNPSLNKFVGLPIGGTLDVIRTWLQERGYLNFNDFFACHTKSSTGASKLPY